VNRYADELEFAVRLVRAAGTVILESYGRVGRVRHKSRRDVVTEVDYRSEALIDKRIRRRFPDDGILAEEAGADRVGGPDGARRWWAVDPLDGTVNYANGIPYFCVSVALIEDKVPVLGVVFDPLRGDLYTAIANGPARLNGSLAKVSAKEALGDCVVSLAILGRGGLSRERKIAPEIRIHRRMGSAALSLASVGAGRFDAFVQNGGLSRWDVAAAGLIAERGGATVTSLTGGPWWQPNRAGAVLNVVAAPEPHHTEILRLLREAGTRVRARR
jgi:myo-inositol-1(or 4)-monophosphatase